MNSVEAMPTVTTGVIDRGSMADRIYSLLKQQILTCKLAPAKRLNEKELCLEMATSRTPLREALNRLAMEELIDMGHYKGYTVAPIAADEVVELCEVRMIVEGGAGALAAKRAREDEIQELENLARLPYQPGDRATYESYLTANRAFHRAIAKCSRNSRLEELVTSILDKLQRPLYLGLDAGLDPLTATAEHLEVVESVRNRDADRASFLMARNASQAKDRMLAALKISLIG